ncbi:MAG TPA: M20/M25/M40 family metallo-hydrolase [Puia sp.]|nr:M20/M25/M40 family metallo-hydrolase [Puia sp.]
MRKLIFLPLFIGIGIATAQDEKLDLDMLQKIRNEGLNNSQVMEIIFNLTDASGPRLEGSPGFFRAANWAKAKLASWGLENAKLEPWGEWGKGWELQKFYIALTAPYYKPLIAFPKSWTSSTNGVQNAEVVMVDAKDSAGLTAFAGKLRGKIIITPRTDTLIPSYKPDATRIADSALEKMAEYDPKNAPERPRGNQRGNFRALMQFSNQLKELAKQEGAIAILTTSPRNAEGTVFVQGGGQFTGGSPENFLDISIAYEDYMTLQRLVQHGISVKLDLDVKSRFLTDDLKGYNVIAEVPGTDKKLKEQLVMMGGHLDAWHGATGATDNAAGCAAMMEAIRILKAVGFKPRRTVRIALWGGEETGLFGSRNYVKNHFTDTTLHKYNADGDRLSVYFNLDNGSGKIRGVYTQGNESVKSIFSQWLKPYNDLGASTITLQNTGGTDHLSFDAIGLPGFQFIQDPIEYDTRTHHSNMDSYDHLQADDLKQAATIIASFVYDASQRDEKIPRKPFTPRQ